MKAKLRRRLLTLLTALGLIFSGLGSIAYAEEGECTHENAAWNEFYPATCTIRGVKRLECPDCKERLQYAYTESLGHSYDSGTVTKNATCTEDGEKLFTCQRASCTAQTDGHTKTETILAAHSYAATWSSDETNHWHECTVCGNRTDVAAHSSSGDATEEKAEVCTVCDYVIAPATGHQHKLTKVEKTPATCEENGNAEYYICEDCGNLYKDEAATIEIQKSDTVEQALGHDYSTEWTDYQGQYHAHSCIRCDSLTDVGAHVPSDSDSTVCAVCGYDKLPEAEHVHADHLTKVEEKDATCTDGGNKMYYTCTCGKIFESADGLRETTLDDVAIPANGHNYADAWSYDSESHWHECTVCKEKEDITFHISSGQATETNAETCTECGYIMTPPLGHIHTEHLTKVEAKDATCTEAGNKAYYACSCGKFFEDGIASVETTVDQETIAALGHIYADTWLYDNTNHWRTCRRCDAVMGITAHISGGAATEEKAEICAECGYVIHEALADTTPKDESVSDTGTKDNSQTVQSQQPKQNVSKTPQTGDERNILVWGTLMFISGAGLVLLSIKTRKFV